MEKIKVQGLNSASVRIDNSGDTAREYAISADCDIAGTALGSANGQVAPAGGGDTRSLASFGWWGEDSSSVSFTGCPPSLQPSVITHINAFIEEARAAAASITVAVQGPQ